CRRRPRLPQKTTGDKFGMERPAEMALRYRNALEHCAGISGPYNHGDCPETRVMPKPFFPQPRKVLTPREMGEVDRRTIESGIPGIILMETAAARVVEYIAAHFSPVSEQRILVICGRGNNGGDGLAIARQLHVRFNPRHLWVILTADPAELTGDAAQNLA